MRRKKTGQVGAVSEGTLRTSDLLDNFLDAAEAISMLPADSKDVKRYRKEYNEAIDDGFSKHEHEQEDNLRGLTELLEAYPPPFCYFGALEGDGSCFGYWVSDEALEEGIAEGHILRQSCDGNRTWYRIGDHNWESREEPPVRLRHLFRLVVSDHGNRELYHRNGRRVWGVV